MAEERIGKVLKLAIPPGIDTERASQYDACPLLKAQVKLAWDLAQGDMSKVVKHLLSECNVPRTDPALRKYIQSRVKEGDLTDYLAKKGLGVHYLH